MLRIQQEGFDYEGSGSNKPLTDSLLRKSELARWWWECVGVMIPGCLKASISWQATRPATHRVNNGPNDRGLARVRTLNQRLGQGQPRPLLLP